MVRIEPDAVRFNVLHTVTRTENLGKPEIIEQEWIECSCEEEAEQKIKELFNSHGGIDTLVRKKLAGINSVSAWIFDEEDGAIIRHVYNIYETRGSIASFK